MDAAVHIRTLGHFGEREIRELSNVLIDCVEGGASVSFMWPMTLAKAEAFWRDAAASALRGERVVIVAEEEAGAAAGEAGAAAGEAGGAAGEVGFIVGTVQVIWAQPENQPHRGDLAKMLVHRRARRRGIGVQLLRAAERAALEAGRTVLVLDTASDDAERLYVRQGWQRVGVVPDFALMPDGPLCATTIFYKSLAR